MWVNNSRNENGPTIQFLTSFSENYRMFTFRGILLSLFRVTLSNTVTTIKNKRSGKYSYIAAYIKNKTKRLTPMHSRWHTIESIVWRRWWNDGLLVCRSIPKILIEKPIADGVVCDNYYSLSKLKKNWDTDIVDENTIKTLQEQYVTINNNNIDLFFSLIICHIIGTLKAKSYRTSFE